MSSDVDAANAVGPVSMVVGSSGAAGGAEPPEPPPQAARAAVSRPAAARPVRRIDDRVVFITPPSLLRLAAGLLRRLGDDRALDLQVRPGRNRLRANQIGLAQARAPRDDAPGFGVADAGQLLELL